MAAVDPHDSVGVLDQYFPEAAFFTEIERFDRHLEKLRRANPDGAVDFVSICAPNHLHDAHIRLALRVGAHAICEKPLVMNPWNLDILQELEREYDRSINTVLQLRVHPKLLELRDRLQGSTNVQRHQVRLSYVTSRGQWYKFSWKGDLAKSGGVATNIGIHFFDLLMWLFGQPERSEVHLSDEGRMAGAMQLQNADVQWFLSIDQNDLPHDVRDVQPTYRSITVDGDEIEFSGGFRDLHTLVYERTIQGDGFGIDAARPAIELVHDLRSTRPQHPTLDPHPFVFPLTATT
ncbi:MAG: Gfo/Idh/MocA family oxidoreductase [Parasphingorhabdus sp.]